jgi:hypothetical protein
MDVERTMPFNLDTLSKLGQLSVELGFMFSPIESTAPSLSEALDIAERSTVLPARVRELVGKGGEGKFFV